MRSLTVAAAAAVVLLAGCGIPGSDDEEPEAASFATTTTTAVEQADTPREAGTVGEWRCGEAKQALYAAVDVLERHAGAADDGLPQTVEEAEEIGDAIETASVNFTSADQRAQDLACRLFGQHDAAIELWIDGNRGDACDVWLPADEQVQQANIELADLHPLSAHMWVAATGQIAEGVGRCIAERAN